jgi:hypothetical protein
MSGLVSEVVDYGAGVVQVVKPPGMMTSVLLTLV